MALHDPIRDFAKEQRRAMTRAETILWRELRAARFNGHKFKRQAPVGRYIPDFVSFGAKLIVELDGEPHLDESRKMLDMARDRWLRSQGFRILRFTNERSSETPQR
jgi:very-short-patch-repair endonuclease